MMKRGKIRKLLCLTAALLLIGGCGGSAAEYDLNKGSAGVSSESSSEELKDQKEGFDYQKTLASKNQTFDPNDTVITPLDQSFSPSEKDYTLMVYMVGSNLESQLGNATADLEEMAGSGIDFKRNNVIVYTGGSRRWAGAIPADKNCVIDLSLPEDKQVVAQTEGNADMGAPETLAAFLTFAREHYDSKHYALILWDHGGGPLWGFGSDELFNSDSIMVSELKKALKSSPFDRVHRLDWVGYDACLMGSFEVMSVWAEYADYYVGSEEVEPGEGWDYSFLKELNKTSDPRKITRAVTDYYLAFYEKEKNETSNPDITLSVTDLKKLTRLESALNKMFKKMDADSSPNKMDYRKRRRDAKGFGLVENEKGGDSFSYDLVDLGSLCEQFRDVYPQECKDTLEVMDNFVVSKVSNVEGSSGVTLYYPSDNKGQYQSMAAEYRNINILNDYVSYLASVTEGWESAKRKDWTIPELEDEGDSYSLTLSEEQIENTALARYSIFKKDNGAYTPLLQKCIAQIDEEGKVLVPKDPELICVTVEGDEEKSIWSAVQLENTSSRNVYRSDFAHLDSNAGDVIFSPNTMQEISVLFKEDKMTGRYQILSIEGVDEGVDFNGKNQIDIENWKTLAESRRAYHVRVDGKGRLLPSKDWEQTYFSLYTWMIGNGFSFEGAKASDFDDPFVVQVEIEDMNGEVYGSPLLELPVSKEYRDHTIDTDHGRFMFKLYDDHAVLADYKGNDNEIVIPDKADGLPVTMIGSGSLKNLRVEKITCPDSVETIGSYAFSDSYDIKEVILPEHLKKIGDSAFYGCGSLKKIDLPDDLEEIGRVAFSRCSKIEKVRLPSGLKTLGFGSFTGCSALKEIDGNCPAVTIKDGTVLSADGKKLLVYPAGRKDKKFTVPEGVKEISYSAFSDAGHLEKVIFSEGLKKIDNNAFCSCRKIKELTFPDSLVHIGMNAFDSNTIHYDDPILSDSTAVISIGKNVRYVGKEAFSNFNRRQFKVDPANRWFIGKKGSLMNKAGDAAVQYKAENNLVYIPAGTLEIDDWTMIEDLKDQLDSDAVMELIIPASVKSIARIPSNSIEIEKLWIHCKEGSRAEKFAREYDIKYDNNMNVEGEAYVDKNEDGQFTYVIGADHASLIRFVSDRKEITIPARVKGVPVTVIGDGQKSLEYYRMNYEMDDPRYRSVVEKINLPDTVTTIEDNAFSVCNNLDELPLPDSLLYIGNHAISGMVYEKLPDSIKRLGKNFAGLQSVSGEITLPAGLKELSLPLDVRDQDFVAFKIDEKNKNYTCRDGILFSKDKKTLICVPKGTAGTYTIPEGTEIIGDHAFEGSLVKEVIFPSSVEKIGEGSFSYCYQLEKVSFNKELKEIGKSCFSSCDQLTSIELPENVKHLRESTFSYCENLSEVSFPEGLLSIEDNCFYDDAALSDVNLPESLTYLGRNAFCDSNEYTDDGKALGIPVRGEKIPSFKIGKNLVTIDANALESLNFEAYDVDPDNSAFSGVDGLLYDKSGYILLKIPPAKEGSLKIPDGTIGIDMDCLKECSRVTDLTIPDSVEYIDYFYLPENTTFHCSKDSAAYRFAKDNDIPVKLIR